MNIKAPGGKQGNFGSVILRCHSCGRDGTFENLPEIKDFQMGDTFLGQRRCPNQFCQAHVFVVVKGQQVVAAYPPQRIDFDKSDIPDNVVSTFEEAISCHATQCFVASAIMVRRSLEEICNDKKATGKNLKARIMNLGNIIIIPQELLEGMNELRLLGNDAAHIEARIFDEIGKKELDVAIKFTKEILKGVYQYSALLKELQSLKTQCSDTTSSESTDSSQPN